MMRWRALADLDNNYIIISYIMLQSPLILFRDRGGWGAAWLVKVPNDISIWVVIVILECLLLHLMIKLRGYSTRPPLIDFITCHVFRVLLSQIQCVLYGSNHMLAICISRTN